MTLTTLMTRNLNQVIKSFKVIIYYEADFKNTLTIWGYQVTWQHKFNMFLEFLQIIADIVYQIRTKILSSEQNLFLYFPNISKYNPTFINKDKKLKLKKL